jgi:hypothetical protein
MQMFRGFKVLLAGGLVSVSVATLAFAGPASAATALSAVTCSHIVGSSSGTATLSGCSAGTGGSGKVSGFLPTGGKVKWSNGTKTSYTDKYTGGGTKCPSGTTEFNMKGHVSSSTNKSIAKGAVVMLTVCFYSSGAIKSASGTVVQF